MVDVVLQAGGRAWGTVGPCRRCGERKGRRLVAGQGAPTGQPAASPPTQKVPSGWLAGMRNE